MIIKAHKALTRINDTDMWNWGRVFQFLILPALCISMINKKKEVMSGRLHNQYTMIL